MDFFVVLRERASARRYGWESEKYCTGHKMGIKATIEALKEMMVGEPMPGKLAHTDTMQGGRYTDVFFNEQFDDFCISAKWIGTDGEEVVVMVFKKP